MQKAMDIFHRQKGFLSLIPTKGDRKVREKSLCINPCRNGYGFILKKAAMG